MFDFGILGMNARNIYYIRKFNDRTGILLADNKRKTKEFLSARGIPVGTTYAVIRSKAELNSFSFDQIEEDDFVIKPNKWSKGKGIHIVKRIQSEETWNYLYRIQGVLYSEKHLKYLFRDILDGRYSLNGTRDSILIEEKLLPWKEFSLFCKYGLADIRVIVFWLVPVIAMVRIPTEKSEWKANLARWGIALGINISTGKIEKLLSGGKVYTKSFPSAYKHFSGITLPFWDLILLYSSQTQHYTNLGYLALDWVITEDGPKLLEMNARAGLEVQNANLVPLKSRLRQVADLKVTSPEKGVEIARTLFQSEPTFLVSREEFLFLEEDVYSIDAAWEKIPFTLSIDIHREESAISPDLSYLEKDENISCFLIHHGTNFTFHGVTDTSLSPHTAILGRKSIEGYYIKPEKRSRLWNTDTYLSLRSIDQRIHALGKAVNLSRIFRPTNYQEELDTFLSKKWKYDPIFSYDFPDPSALHDMEIQLELVRDELVELWVTKGMGKLLYEKTDEILIKKELILACIDEDASRITLMNERLYGRIDPLLLEQAKDRIHTHNVQEMESISYMSHDSIMRYVKEYLSRHWMSHIDIRFEKNSARMSVKYSNNIPRISISPLAQIREVELESILAHEVGVHLRRYQNGSRTWWSILKYGTGFYLEDEEWLAVYESLLALPEWEEKMGMYKKYIISHEACTTSFRELVWTIENYYPEKRLEQIFSDCYRAKKGIMNTRKILSAFQKDIVYLNGYTKIKNWVENGWDREKMFVGKVKVENLAEVENL